MGKLKLSQKQQDFIDAVLEGKNIFLTGKAGTGKSHVVMQAIKLLEQKNKKVIAVAPTGIAANNISGQTIHSMFNINPYGVSDYKSCNFLKGEKRRLLRAVDTIFIDEVSMLRPDLIDGMHYTLIKNGIGGLNSKQIIFIGDMKQLQPVINDNTRSVLYETYNGDTFLDSKIFEKLNVVLIELDEVLRQSDEEFIKALNVVRDGGKDPYFRQFVSDKPKGIILAPYNHIVKKYNEEGLESIGGEKFTFFAEIEGNVKYDDFNLEPEINVKNGCTVMYLVNSKDNPLVNGTIGTFISHAGCHYIRVGNTDFAIEPIELHKKEYVYDESQDKIVLKSIGSISQYPIKLAFALSIHKSQGLTFDEVTVDLTKPCFQKEQLYVALSRVRTPNGLTIIH